MRVENYRTPLASSKHLAGKGLGSFAADAIPRGTVIAAFGGVASSLAGLNEFPAERISRSIQVEADLFLVGPVTREPGDIINHSCSPNCGMRNATQVVAMRDIALGEELTFDYATTDTLPYDEFECTCGSNICRRRVSAEDWRIQDLQVRMAGWFAPHVQRKIDALGRARTLKKHEAESMLKSFDDDPIASLTRAMRIATGFPHATWEHLVSMLRGHDREALLREETVALDLLAAELNETRTIGRY